MVATTRVGSPCRAAATTVIFALLCDSATSLPGDDLYAVYEAKQQNKLLAAANTTGHNFLKRIHEFDQSIERILLQYLGRSKVAQHIAPYVLCVGARLGGEVRAFQAISNVKLAIGVDIAPGERNPLVMYGDAHELSQFKAATFGCAYSNVLDHILHVDRFAKATWRVLTAGGSLMVDLPEQPLCKDIWAVHDLVVEHQLLVCQIESAGFEVVEHVREPYFWRKRLQGYMNRYIFRKVSADAAGQKGCKAVLAQPPRHNMARLIATIGNEPARNQMFLGPSAQECSLLLPRTGLPRGLSGAARQGEHPTRDSR